MDKANKIDSSTCLLRIKLKSIIHMTLGLIERIGLPKFMPYIIQNHLLCEKYIFSAQLNIKTQKSKWDGIVMKFVTPT